MFHAVISVSLLHMVYRKTRRKTLRIIISIIIHSSCCVLNIMFPTCRPNRAEVALTSCKVEWARNTARIR